jgi:hypothetical protein
MFVVDDLYRLLRSVAFVPLASKRIETGELALRYEEFRFAWETSHAGIIRIGFEGISQPHLCGAPLFQ